MPGSRRCRGSEARRIASPGPVLGPSDGAGLQRDGLRLFGENWDLVDLAGVEVFFDTAEGHEALEHVDECLWEGVEGELELIEDDDGSECNGRGERLSPDDSVVPEGDQGDENWRSIPTPVLAVVQYIETLEELTKSHSTVSRWYSAAFDT